MALEEFHEYNSQSSRLGTGYTYDEIERQQSRLREEKGDIIATLSAIDTCFEKYDSSSMGVIKGLFGGVEDFRNEIKLLRMETSILDEIADKMKQFNVSSDEVADVYNQDMMKATSPAATLTTDQNTQL